MTPTDKLADALSCFRNPTLDTAHSFHDSRVAAVAYSIVAGVEAVAKRLREPDASLAAPPAQGEFLTADEQPPFAGIAGCRPLERAPHPAPGKRGAQTADDCWRYSPSVPLNPTQNALSILYDLGHDEGRYPEDHHAGKWAQVEAAYAAVAALAQQRVPDAVRELPGKWRLKAKSARAYGHVEEALAREFSADELESALATIDQQQEARGNGE